MNADFQAAPESLTEDFEKAKKEAQSALSKLEEIVKENPVASVAAAATLGIFLGLILSRKN